MSFPHLCCVALALWTGVAHAQRAKDPLTAAEEDQVREVADQPDERVKLYIKFIEARTEAIHHNVRHPDTQHPGVELHDSLEAFTRLVDELQDNLDTYEEQHLDVRKGLRLLQEHEAKWPDVLREPPASPQYDFGRKSALDSVATLAESSKTMLKAQEEYFARHKPPKN